MKSYKFPILTLAAAGSLLGGCLDETPAVQRVATDPNQSTPSLNSPPVISGTPAQSSKVAEAYSFLPQSSDADGDDLSFTITNRPSWSSFDSQSGALTGVPTLGDVGVYESIRISVSDGQATASLPQFAISVDQIGTASTTLSWTAPSQNEDGSPLTDLAGFRIYYGKSSGSYTDQISVNNPGVTSLVVDNLTPDTYYFAATAFNTSGFESRFSSEAIKTVN